MIPAKSHLVTSCRQTIPEHMLMFCASFVELGPKVLSQEDAWFCAACARSTRASNIDAGVAQAFKMRVKELFCRSDCSPRATGVALGACRLYSKLGMVLQDGGAQKLIWLIKGDAGTTCCMLCRSVIALDSTLVDEDGVTLLGADVMRELDIDFATNDDTMGGGRSEVGRAPRR